MIRANGCSSVSIAGVDLLRLRPSTRSQMSVSYAAESWPEHSDDLKTIIVGQCAVQLYGSALEISVSSAEMSEINKLVETHPLNETQEQFGVDTCAKIIQSLAQENSESQSMANFKFELLKKVQLYIERGLSVLRNEPTLETLSPSQKSRKRTRSQSEVDKPARKQKLESEVASSPKSRFVTPLSGGSTLPAEPEAIEQNIQQELEPTGQKSPVEEPNTEEPSLKQRKTVQLDTEQSNTEQSNTERTNADRPGLDKFKLEHPALEKSESGKVLEDTNEQETRPEETNLSEEDQQAAKNHSELEAEQAELQKQREDQRAQEQQERINRRRSRTRRSARNTPEPAAQPTVQPASETKAEPKSFIEGTSRSGPQEESSEFLPENKELGDEKAGSSQSPVSDKEEKGEDYRESEKMFKNDKGEPPAKRKRSVTFDDSGLSPLSELLYNLISHKAMAPFKDTDFHDSPIVLSPISLETILENVQNNNLDTVDDVQVELLKLVANGVMAAEVDRKQSKNAIAVIDSAISQFREDTLGSISNSKRRRR